ncbi:CorA family divalent cation transporter [Streptomyces sp. NPDC057686]|uniref:CorA family divalent cation transporter n=1 Tax=Streptomyces sp. NPDC057686 TaxID=3346212 RepID=UPI003674198F
MSQAMRFIPFGAVCAGVVAAELPDRDHAYLEPVGLVVEGVVQAHQRPKRERFGDVLAVALKALWYAQEETAVETGELRLFVGPRCVLTVRQGELDQTADADRRMDADPSMLRFDPLSVLHAVLDVIVDARGEAAETVRAALW